MSAAWESDIWAEIAERQREDDDQDRYADYDCFLCKDKGCCECDDRWDEPDYTHPAYLPS